MMSFELVIIAAFLLVLSLAVTAISGKAFFRTRSKKVMFFSIAFLIFSVKAGLFAWAVVGEGIDLERAILYGALLDLCAFGLLFASILVRRN